MGDAVVTEGKGEAGVDDVAEAVDVLVGLVEKRIGDFEFVIAELPDRVGAEVITEDDILIRFLGANFPALLRFHRRRAYPLTSELAAWVARHLLQQSVGCRRFPDPPNLSPL